MADQTTIHATCLALQDRGILLRGRSGVGKSDLALRLIDSGAILVSDDQVVISKSGTFLIASPPAALAGLLEVRGIGICQYPFKTECNLRIVVDLDQECSPERLPDLSVQNQKILGVSITTFFLDPFQASAPAKVRAMLDVPGLVDH